jgi:hypothetical protein
VRFKSTSRISALHYANYSVRNHPIGQEMCSLPIAWKQRPLLSVFSATTLLSPADQLASERCVCTKRAAAAPQGCISRKINFFLCERCGTIKSQESACPPPRTECVCIYSCYAIVAKLLPFNTERPEIIRPAGIPLEETPVRGDNNHKKRLAVSHCAFILSVRVINGGIEVWAARFKPPRTYVSRQMTLPGLFSHLACAFNKPA